MNDNTQTLTLRFAGEITLDSESLFKLLRSEIPALPQLQSPKSTGNDPLRLAYSVQETADLLGISYKSVYRLIQRRLLKPSGAMRHKLISKTEIERFLKETTSYEY